MRFILLSALLHAPLTPLASVLGWLSLLDGRSDEAIEPVLPLTEIPLDLLESELPGSTASRPPQGVPGADAPSGVSMPAPATPELADAGMSTAHDAGPGAAGQRDAGSRDKAHDAGADAAEPGTDDAGADGALADAAPPRVDGGIGDPVVAAGEARRIVDPNANVRVMIYNERVRQNPLGARISALLKTVPQWRDFFGPGGVDPIRDVDQMLIVGPQLRDSSQVVAVLKHHVPSEQMRSALSALVARDSESGAWLDGGVPAARARADRAERLFVMPSHQIVLVVPPSAAASALKLSKRFSLPEPKGPEALLVYLATPWRALQGTPLRLPRTLKWARLKVTTDAAGGAVAEFEAEDESAESAAQNARSLEREARSLNEMRLGLLGALLGQSERFVDLLQFSSEGNRILGEARANPRQLSSLLDLMALGLEAWGSRGARDAASRAQRRTAVDADAIE